MANSFRYKTKFDGWIIKASVDKEVDKYLSLAALEDLKALGLEKEVDFDVNYDLTGIVFNAAVVNRLNKNDEGISTEVALAIKNQFAHKPINIEHKTRKVIGHLVKPGWSAFETNKPLTDEEVGGTKEPFYITLGGVLYNFVDTDFVNAVIESSDETSRFYKQISASWEIAFENYHLVIGSKNISEAEIVSDEAKIEELSKYLTQNGGSGKLPDGRYIGRMIVGDKYEVLPIGIGLTSKPAAEVEGVVVIDPNEGKGGENGSKASDENAERVESQEKNQKIISQSAEVNVNEVTETKSDMKFQNLDELMKAIETNAKSVSKASVAEFVTTELSKKAEEYETNLKAKETAAADIKSRADGLSEALATANTKLANLETELAKMKDEASAKANADLFQERMTAIAAEFELTEKQFKIVASEINGLSDENYKAWYGKFEVLSNDRKKSVIAARIKDEQDKLDAEIAKAKVSTASVAAMTIEQVGDIAAAATAVGDTGIVNTSAATEKKTSAEDWKDAFGGEKLKVSF